MATKAYNIVLEKGEALKPFYELSPEEKEAVGRKAFQLATDRAAAIGEKPVTRKNVKSRLF